MCSATSFGGASTPKGTTATVHCVKFVAIVIGAVIGLAVCAYASIWLVLGVGYLIVDVFQLWEPGENSEGGHLLVAILFAMPLAAILGAIGGGFVGRRVWSRFAVRSGAGA